MKAQTLAPFAFAAAVEGLGLLSGLGIDLPLGIDIDILSSSGSKPKSGPCDECTNVYHPPHRGVDIDECDNDEDDGWHWVHPGKPHHPEQPKHTWGTSTVTCSETSTIIGCPDDVEYCPGRSTAYTTVTQVESTTICPVPITTSEYHEPPATETYVHVQPTTSVHYPPIRTTTIPPEEYYTETKVAGPPAVHTSVYVPEHPAETPAYPPPAKVTSVWVPPPGQPQHPAPPAEYHPAPPTQEHPAPPAQEYPAPPTEEHPAPPAPEHPAPPAEEHPPVWVAPPAETPMVPGGNNTMPPPPVATAGASQTVQRVGLAAFAMVAAAFL